ncbi:hypothetical protein KP509_31G071800 [Ceratopteris richardii]|uniref:SIAH-type domain-containing protein n=1 Tax=Ceratopteris richardii TaxID=49495 RepID=A0A8T2R0X5_CERRI|nr:hypothetical protein KP509_31G071800 [Ceratopteris richardii]
MKAIWNLTSQNGGMKFRVNLDMVRFSTTLCPSEEPPPAKRLKTSAQQEEQEREKELLVLPKSRAPPSSSNSTCSSSSGGSGVISSCDSFASLDLDILDCNLGLEKILESLRIRCKFSSIGCTEGMLPYRFQKIHERKCRFAPRECPLSDCAYMGSLDTFSSHFELLHSVKTLPFCFDTWFTVRLSMTDNHLLLQGGNDYYLLQAHEERFGKLLYVSFVSPPESDEVHTYQMEVKTGKKHLTLTSSVQNVQQGKLNLNLVDFLLVPRCFLSDEGLQVEVSIKRVLEV